MHVGGNQQRVAAFIGDGADAADEVADWPGRVAIAIAAARIVRLAAEPRIITLLLNVRCQLKSVLSGISLRLLLSLIENVRVVVVQQKLPWSLSLIQIGAREEFSVNSDISLRPSGCQFQ